MAMNTPNYVTVVGKKSKQYNTTQWNYGHGKSQMRLLNVPYNNICIICSLVRMFSEVDFEHTLVIVMLNLAEKLQRLPLTRDPSHYIVDGQTRVWWTRKAVNIVFSIATGF